MTPPPRNFRYPAGRSRTVATSGQPASAVPIPDVSQPAPDLSRAKPQPVKPKQAKAKAPRVREKTVQRGIVQTLRWLGYKVMETGRPIPRKCVCGRLVHGATGNTEAVADLLVSAPWWYGKWIMLEVKVDEKSAISQGQKDLADEGFSTIITNGRDAVLRLLQFETSEIRRAKLRDWLALNTKGDSPIGR